VSIYVDTFGTGKVDEGILEQFLIEQDFIQLTPRGIIEKFGLQHPEGWSYVDTAAYGHFGKSITLGNNLTWFLFLRTISPCMHAQVVSCP